MEAEMRARNLALILLVLIPRVSSSSLEGLFLSYELKKHLLRFFQCDLSQLDLKVRSVAPQAEGAISFDGDLQATELEFPTHLSSLARDVVFDASMSVVNLKLKETKDQPIPYELIYDPATRFVGTLNVTGQSIHQAIENVMKKDSSIRSWDLRLEADKIHFEARAGNRLGGVRMAIDLGFILHKVNSLGEGGKVELTILKEEIQGWGFGKMKVGEARRKVRELVEKASLALPLDEIYKGFIVRELSLSEDGLEIKVENKVQWKESLAALSWVREFLEPEGS
jgi:hypothetical protein